MKPAEVTPPAAVENKPVEENKPVAAVAEPVKPAEPVKAPEEKEKSPAVNVIELLAGLKKISIRLGPSFDATAKSSLNQSVTNQAKVAVRKLGVELVEKAPNVLEVNLSTTTANEKFNVVLTAELKCPGSDGKEVSVWKKSEPILSVDPTKMDEAKVMKLLRTTAGKRANEFFERFIEDLKKAREAAGQK